MVERIQRMLELAHPQRTNVVPSPVPLEPTAAANNGKISVRGECAEIVKSGDYNK